MMNKNKKDTNMKVNSKITSNNNSKKELRNSLGSISDEELIVEIQTGNNKAWEILCENYNAFIERIARSKMKKIDYKSLGAESELFQDLCQAGRLGFVDAFHHYNDEKKKNSKFQTYATYYINGEMTKALDDYLNRTGVTGRVKYHQVIQSCNFDELKEEPKMLLPGSADESGIEDHEQLIEKLKKELKCTNQGSYSETARAIQLLEILKMMTDEKHTLSKSQLYGMLELYRLAKDKNSTKLEGDNTLGPVVQKLLQAVNPLEYTVDNDAEYLIKYKDYEKNLVQKNMELDQAKKSGQKVKSKTEQKKGGKKATITDLYYEHPFSYAELDQLISLVAFSDVLTEDDKLQLIEKLRDTSSIYYKTPFVNDYSQRIQYKEKKIADRFSPGATSTRADLPANLKILQDAINHLVQVQFRFCRYNEKGELDVDNGIVHTVSPYHIVVYHDQYYLIALKDNGIDIWHFRIDLMRNVQILLDDKGRQVPIDIRNKDTMPSSIRSDEWNPEQYMAEHLYMGYDKPKNIQIKIKNTNYTILQDWFGDNYRKLRKKCEEGYDIVEVKTSPSMMVHWAMRYSSYVEILDVDVRERIREELKKMKEKYGE